MANTNSESGSASKVPNEYPRVTVQVGGTTYDRVAVHGCGGVIRDLARLEAFVLRAMREGADISLYTSITAAGSEWVDVAAGDLVLLEVYPVGSDESIVDPDEDHVHVMGSVVENDGVEYRACDLCEHVDGEPLEREPDSNETLGLSQGLPSWHGVAS